LPLQSLLLLLRRQRLVCTLVHLSFCGILLLLLLLLLVQLLLLLLPLLLLRLLLL
jgi:hypothetical protein